VLLCALLTILCVVVLQEQVKVHVATAQPAGAVEKGNAIGFAVAYKP
jgi:dihydroxyacetone kinase-like predicted kinase